MRYWNSLLYELQICNDKLAINRSHNSNYTQPGTLFLERCMQLHYDINSHFLQFISHHGPVWLLKSPPRAHDSSIWVIDVWSLQLWSTNLSLLIRAPVLLASTCLAGHLWRQSSQVASGLGPRTDRQCIKLLNDCSVTRFPGGLSSPHQADKVSISWLGMHDKRQKNSITSSFTRYECSCQLI